MAAPISPPIPSVTPVRNRPRETAARALAGSAYAPAAPAAASCPVWPPEGSATSLTSSEGVATGILRPQSDRCQRGNRPHKVPADFAQLSLSERYEPRRGSQPRRPRAGAGDVPAASRPSGIPRSSHRSSTRRTHLVGHPRDLRPGPRVALLGPLARRVEADLAAHRDQVRGVVELVERARSRARRRAPGRRSRRAARRPARSRARRPSRRPPRRPSSATAAPCPRSRASPSARAPGSASGSRRCSSCGRRRRTAGRSRRSPARVIWTAGRKIRSVALPSQTSSDGGTPTTIDG